MRFVGAKRLMDTVLVVAAAPLWVPILAGALLASGVGAGRPLLYKQRRMGMHGEPFEILKIRTMRDEVPAPVGVLFAGWTYPGDPRVTRVGRVLRKHRLDELPQLWNVLRGDMSLVGPRPEPWDVAEALGREIPRYHDRHRVRPGLTGPCQLSPDYLDFGTVQKSARKLQHDLRYVDAPRLRRDLGLLARTVRVLLRGVGVA